MELTPLEIYKQRQTKTITVIRTLVALDKIVKQLDEVDAGMTMLDWRNGDEEERAVYLEALKEKRDLNAALVMCSNLMQTEAGIEA
jgi:hypothetical protein